VNSQDLAITWQDVFFTLKFYEMAPGGEFIQQFLEEYDPDKDRIYSTQATLDLKNGVKFPEYMSILARFVLFLKQTNNLSQEYESLVPAFIEKIIKIHGEEENLAELHRHLLFSDVLMDQVKNSIEVLKSLFILKLKDALQVVENKHFMLKGEISSIIKETGFGGDNLDEIIDTCFNDVMPGKKYEKFEGLYFYEYLQALMWISVVFIQKSEESSPKPDSDETEISEDVLLEKFKFLTEVVATIVKNSSEDAT